MSDALKMIEDKIGFYRHREETMAAGKTMGPTERLSLLSLLEHARDEIKHWRAVADKERVRYEPAEANVDVAASRLDALLSTLDVRDDKLSADAAAMIRKLQRTRQPAMTVGRCLKCGNDYDPHHPCKCDRGPDMFLVSLIQAIEFKLIEAKLLIGGNNDTLRPAVREANVNKAWHVLTATEAIVEKAKGVALEADEVRLADNTPPEVS